MGGAEENEGNVGGTTERDIMGGVEVISAPASLGPIFGFEVVRSLGEDTGWMSMEDGVLDGVARSITLESADEGFCARDVVSMGAVVDASDALACCACLNRETFRFGATSNSEVTPEDSGGVGGFAGRDSGTGTVDDAVTPDQISMWSLGTHTNVDLPAWSSVTALLVGTLPMSSAIVRRAFSFRPFSSSSSSLSSRPPTSSPSTSFPWRTSAAKNGSAGSGLEAWYCAVRSALNREMEERCLFEASEASSGTCYRNRI